MPEYKRDDSESKWVRCESWEQVRAELKALLENEPDSGFKVQTSSNKGDESRAEDHPETKSLFEHEGEAIESQPTVTARQAIIGLAVAATLVLAHDLLPVAVELLRGDIDRRAPEPSLASEPVSNSADQEREESLGLGTESWQRIQTGLRSAGFDPGPTDGSPFDENVRDAIRNWQASRGGQPTGFLSAAEAIELAGLGEESMAANGSEQGAATLYEINELALSLGSPRDPPQRVAVEPRQDRAEVTGARGASPTRRQSSASTPSSTTPPNREASRPIRSPSVPSGRASEVKVAESENDRGAKRATEPVPEPQSAVAEGPGRLTARANATGATIQLDRGKAMDLPLRSHQLVAGSYRATISAFGFETLERDFDVDPSKETVLDITLEPTPFEELLSEARDRYLAEDFKGARDRVQRLLTIHPDEGAAILLLGESLYRLGEFHESETQLRQALRRGETVTLPAKHRHGGLGLREGFCRGILKLSKAEVSYRSSDQPKHGFTITPNQLREVVAAEKTYRDSVTRIDTKIQDRGNKGRDFDFVHWNSERVPERRGDSSLLDLQCRYCDGSMNIQLALMQYLQEASM